MRLGEILVAANACDEETIAKGLEHSHFSNNRLGSSLIELGLVSSDIIAAALGKQHGLSSAKEANFQAIEPAVIALLSGAQAYAHKALPLGIHRGTGELAVAMRDPEDLGAIDALHAVTGKAIIVAAASELRIQQGLLEHYGAPELLPLIPEEEPLDLELAAPPKLEARATVPLIADSPSPNSPATLLPEARVGNPDSKFDLRAFLGTGRGILISAVTIIALLAIAKFSYDRFTDKDIPVSGSFKVSNVNLRLTLPKTGWIYAPSADEEESRGPVTVRVAMLYRGDSISKANDALWLMQITGPFAGTVSEAQFDAITQELNQADPSQVSLAGFAVRELACDRSDRRPGLTAQCVGNGYYKGTTYQLSVFLWQERDNSIVAALFLTQGEFNYFNDEIDSILSSIRLL